ncbi:carbohydrate ABC transporter permease [Roseomonas sp. AR75]|uniref:carbohydrate ABC transporter permease n=1 Tax=Roseomonas sp. AR75 TaxID=2562311 RepID=UPI0010C05871|nr:carbohydrate ABC transporter permease [Roseomonas sp. AR75]
MRRWRHESGLQLALLLGGLLIAAPFAWVVAAGFRTQISLLMGEVWFTPTLSAFEEVLFSKTSDFLLNVRNSTLIGLASTAIALAAATFGAWSLHRMRWPRWWVHALLLWALVLQMIPPVALAGGWFVMARAVGLDNTLMGLILAHATLNLPMALWMMGVFVRDVPQELVEAARLDGASTPTLLWRVVLPLVAPGLAAAGVLCFVFSWNEFAAALNLSMRQTATVPVAIAKFAQDFEIRYVQMAAAASLSAVPALLLLLVAQRWIVKGLTLGAVK